MHYLHLRLLTVLTCVPKEWSGTVTSEGVPKVRAFTVRMARIRFTLFGARTTALDIFQFGITDIRILLIGKDPFTIDHYILHAAHKS